MTSTDPSTSMALVGYGSPLEAVSLKHHEPTGTEVVLRVTHCGVCHSDLHLQDGYFNLGGDKRLDIGGTHTLPLVLGHEICGEIAAVGPQAADAVRIGDRRVVYGWIGCGDCPACDQGDEHLCSKPRALGINVDGGYGTRVVIPHPRYLLPYAGVPDAAAGTFMCSGLTAYSALAKLGRPGKGDSVAIVGLGGVGMMGLMLSRRLFPDARIIGLDVDDAKLEAARARGIEAYSTAADEAPRQLLKATAGGVAGTVDFVGSEASLGIASRIARKGGRIVIVGLFGGRFSMPIPMFPFRSLSLIGSYVGTLEEARRLMALAADDPIEPIPIELRPLRDANRALDDLRAGKVLGRLVLDCAG